jgi:hypothetical protein
MRFPLIATVIVSFIACASSKPKATPLADARNHQPTLQSNANGPNARGKYVCDFEEDTGSHLRQKVCRYIDNDNDARGQTQDWIRAQEMSNFSRPKGG